MWTVHVEQEQITRDLCETVWPVLALLRRLSQIYNFITANTYTIVITRTYSYTEKYELLCIHIIYNLLLVIYMYNVGRGFP